MAKVFAVVCLVLTIFVISDGSVQATRNVNAWNVSRNAPVLKGSANQICQTAASNLRIFSRDFAFESDFTAQVGHDVPEVAFMGLEPSRNLFEEQAVKPV